MQNWFWWFTWIGAGEDGGAAEVAAGLDGVLLVVVVEGVGGVIADGVRAEAAPALLDGGAVRAALPARVVQRHLQRRGARAGARHAPAPAAGKRRRPRRRRRGGHRRGRRDRRVHHRDGGQGRGHVALRRAAGAPRLGVLCWSLLASSPWSMKQTNRVSVPCA